MSKSLEQTRQMTMMAIMIALNCVSAYIIVPLPFSLSPISLQTMIVNLTGFVLDAKHTFMAFVAYLLVGLAGVPVFTGGSAGPGKLFGPTGGYIFGFVVAAVINALLKGEKYSFKRYALIGVVCSIPVIYLFGCVQLKLVTGMGWDKAIMSGALPFIPMDIVKAVAAAFLAGPILKAIHKN